MNAGAVAVAARACPGVSDLYGGASGEIATYLPGTRVHGVRYSGSCLEVHVVAAWQPDLQDLAQRVRAAVAPLAGVEDIAIFIDDIDIASTEEVEPLVVAI